ncbi:MAG: DUF99 family protein [Candidatus Bathyarchaeales archaeon]
MRVVGIEDGSFKKGVTKRTLIAAVLFDGLKIEDVKLSRIDVDGLDATEKVVNILTEWEFEVVMLAGVSFAGFNIIDHTVLFKKFAKPILIISRTKPDNKAVKYALRAHFRDWQIRWGVFEKLGPVQKVTPLAKENPLYCEILGADAHWAKRLIKDLAVCGRVPEPLRVARLVARGLS